MAHSTRAAVIVFAALVMTLAAMPARAFELKGFTLGATQAEIVKKLSGLNCPIPDPPKPLDDCTYIRQNTFQPNITELNTIAEELVERWEFRFAKGRLGAIQVILSHSSFEAVRAALARKYGQPTERRREQAQNRLGAKFAGDVEVWRRPDGVLTVQEYAGSTEFSAVTLAAPWFTKSLEKHEASEARRRANDL